MANDETDRGAVSVWMKAAVGDDVLRSAAGSPSATASTFSCAQTDDLPPAELALALSIDQRRSWQEGIQTQCEDYARRFPNIAEDRELLLDLVYNEYLLRQLHGPEPGEREFLARFPQLVDQLRRLFEVHRTIESNGETNGDKLRVDSMLGVASNGARKSSMSPFLGYELLEEIGRGGMGVVYKARQVSTQRIVALKVILAGRFASDREVARFRSEAVAAARVDHPGIVPVYEFAQDGPLFYYSMAYIEGENLASQLSTSRPTPARAAELARQIAQAVHYAHTRGITHRDLKPQNILIDQDGQPRIVDFGLAKSDAHEGSLTITGQLLGTANYVAPEQAMGEQCKIGPASDIFAVGAILYEMLTGQPPFSASTVVGVLTKVVHDQPTPPRAIESCVPRDLETICMKCLAKDPASRYASARALSDDLERFLAGRTILARPVPWWESAWMWCRRYPAIATLTAAIALLAVLLGISNRALRGERDRALSSERQLQESRRQALVHLGEAYLNEARALRRSNHAGRRLDSLAAVANAARLFHELGHTADGRRSDLRLRNDAVACLTREDISLISSWPIVREGFVPAKIAGAIADAPPFSFDAHVKQYVAIDEHHALAIRNLETNDVLTRFSGTWPNLRGIRFNAQGTRLAGVEMVADGQRVLVWRTDRPDGQPEDFGECSSGSFAVDFAPDGKTLAIVESGGAIRLVDIASHEVLERLTYEDLQAIGCRYHPSRAELAIWQNNIVRIVSPPFTKGVDYVHAPDQRVQHLAWSESAEQFATGLSDHNACIWNLDSTQEPVKTLRGHQSWVYRVAFQPQGQVLLTSSTDGTTRFWNSATGSQLFVAQGYCIDFSRDGRRIGGVFDGRVAGWQFVDALECQTLGTAGRYEAYFAAVSPCGRWLATTSWAGVFIWDLRHRELLTRLHEGDAHAVAFSPDGRSLVAGTKRGFLLWNLPAEISAAALSAIAPRRMGPQEIQCPLTISFSDDGRFLTVSQHGSSYFAQNAAGTLYVAGESTGDADTGTPSDAEASDYVFSQPMPYDMMTVSPSGDYVASASGDQCKVDVRLVGAVASPADRPFIELLVMEMPTALRFTPDERWLIVGTTRECLLFDCQTWQLARRLACGTDLLGRLDMTRDGQTLAIGRADFSIQLVDLASLQTSLILPSNVPWPWVCLSPDGRWLACCGEDASTRLWDLPLVWEQLARIGLDQMR
jgi:WD40 repeat protein/tRNA A-37 threonylcarbamoyl transferase component Bud32